MMKMEAGRELDAMVAEKVMGWEFYQEQYVGSLGVAWISKDPNGEELFSDSKCGFPHYSADIAAAWTVVDRMWQTFPGLIVTHWFDDSGAPYIVSFGNRNKGSEIASAEAETFPLAICLASLRAVGVEVE